MICVNVLRCAAPRRLIKKKKKTEIALERSFGLAKKDKCVVQYDLRKRIASCSTAKVDFFFFKLANVSVTFEIATSSGYLHALSFEANNHK